MSLLNTSELPSLAAARSGRERWGRMAIRLFVLAVLPVLGMACDEAAEPEAATPPPEAAPSAALPRIKWLDPHATATPERWLASRAAKVDLAEKDPAVLSMRENLHLATQRFGDPPRMIANRAVQLEEMLASEGIDESAPELILSFSLAASETHPREGFGSLCQHYFNLRKQGLDREAALEQLKLRSSLDAGEQGRQG